MYMHVRGEANSSFSKAMPAQSSLFSGFALGQVSRSSPFSDSNCSCKPPSLCTVRTRAFGSLDVLERLKRQELLHEASGRLE